MNIQTIIIQIPIEKEIPSILSSFNVNENYVMLQIGINAIMEAKKSVIELTNKEIYKNISEEYKNKINELENEILLEKKVSYKSTEIIRQNYEDQLNFLNTKINQLSLQLIELNDDKNINELINKEIEKIKNTYEKILEEKNEKEKFIINSEIEKINYKYDLILKERDRRENNLNMEIEKNKRTYELLLQEKDKQCNLFRESFDNALINVTNISKTNVKKGIKGETMFQELAMETFKDFKDFDIKDKHNESSSGDFHLHFDEFDVLVDVKNHMNFVDSTQINKIKHDLKRNSHIKFAWLISLDGSIMKYDRFPIMCEYINSEQCVIYINNLLGGNIADKMLRIAWVNTSLLNEKIELLNSDNENSLELKNKYDELINFVKNIKTSMREINTSINTLKKQCDSLCNVINNRLDNETNIILETNYSAIDDWWCKNIEKIDDDSQLISTKLWYLFKNNNEELVSKFKITTDNFKQYIIAKLPIENYTMKNKSSSILITGYKLLKNEEITIDNQNELLKSDNKTEYNINTEIIKNNLKNKKNAKKCDNLYFISEEMDNKVLYEYNINNCNIIEIARENNLLVNQIISILTKHKIISKKCESRGYNLYLESDEYKLKIKSLKV